MTEFEKWDKAFRNQNMNAFNNDSDGLLWLKVRAICRTKQLVRFARENDIVLTGRRLSDRNLELYEVLKKRSDASVVLDRFLQNVENEWYATADVDVDRLKEDLYKVRFYEWGGD